MKTADVEVHVARVVDTPALRGLLDDGELARLDTLVRAQDRARLVASHVLLRRALAVRCGVDAGEIVLERRCPTCGSDEHGRLEAPDLGVHVSLGHAGDLVAVALSPDGPVGVDVEVESACDFEGFDEVSLHPQEQARLAALPEGERTWARATWWVRKEATLKATGHGLTVDPASVRVTPPDEEPAVVGWPEEPRPVIHLEDLRVPDGHVAAVALHDADDRVAAMEVTRRDGDELLDLG
ncbi:4'-phosphopantetheinyl transferase family protein [Arsenicicoccus dermatophilus]|uniref:4'-phosphopantetheinyl transferase family protein n=1 Tax=Arsenicicoccus dermatophilus TaxID=1076331 RepID=UPI001F4C7380|nr:4'-phosphopantetheinyl transferase superfamily protein [Arsenicicoccus dermatophilus]MCH8613490.1 4'-phosphopantetheinyl transferase superfamily protein [Arsenicicoccus dermatophilus]